MNHRVSKYRLRASDQPRAAEKQRARTQRQVAEGELPFSTKGEDGFGDRSFVVESPGGASSTDAEPAGATADRKKMSATEKLSALRTTLNSESLRSAARKLEGQQIASNPKKKIGGGKKKKKELDLIAAENLTARQLRIARRIARKQGLEAESDLDAVRLLRQQGTDPFNRENILDLVSTPKQPEAPNQLPQTVPQPLVPSTEVNKGGDIAFEVGQIQKEIAARRRKRMVLLTARLVVFILLPTLLTGYYYFRIATPMYASHSQFVIQQADSGGGGGAGGLGGMLAGSGLASSQDAGAVQNYLQSRNAMARLDSEMGYKAHFSASEIDPIQRLEPDSTDETAYKHYKRHVKISYDPTEGFVKMEVIAADPAIAQEYSQSLISYAEELVDNLSQRKRADQMSGARESYEEAEANVTRAQQRVLELQEQRGVLSAEMEVTSLMSQISTLETELNTERLRLDELLENPRPNQTRVTVLKNNIARLEDLIADMRGEMTVSQEGDVSLARVSGELVIAETDLETRQLLLGQALQQLETARIEANRQVRYLSTSVSPYQPDQATYPRALENTILALLVFSGIYLMVSLTASILREQITG